MKRNYIVTLHRARQPVGTPRHYSRLDTAFPRCVQRLLQDGQPGDLYEVAHAEFGFQIGTIKVHTGGKIDLKISPELLAKQHDLGLNLAQGDRP